MTCEHPAVRWIGPVHPSMKYCEGCQTFWLWHSGPPITVGPEVLPTLEDLADLHRMGVTWA